MPEPEKPELEAVAWRARQRNTRPNGESTSWHYGESLPAPTPVEWEDGVIVRDVELLCSLSAALKLVAQRDERIRELGLELAELRPAVGELVAYLEGDGSFDEALRLAANMSPRLRARLLRELLP